MCCKLKRHRPTIYTYLSVYVAEFPVFVEFVVFSSSVTNIFEKKQPYEKQKSNQFDRGDCLLYFGNDWYFALREAKSTFY